MHGLSCGMYYFMDFSVGFLHVFDLFLNFSTLLFKLSQIILMASQGWEQLVLQSSELTRILCLMVFQVAITIAVHVHQADQVHPSQCACLTLPQPYPNLTKRNLKLSKFRLIWGTQLISGKAGTWPLAYLTPNSMFLLLRRPGGLFIFI